ncbi:hypothetical protein Tco_0749303 [Tanacetum coccineum]|uniref:Xylulose kinase-1 n=1 Tax=Tanacetum coccineum TaxID=301880 RepID=A0ABQ4Z0T3_9ASTR
MSDLKFADTHNLVAILEKPTESEGFEEIVDFLNANPIKYALTVNPTIYCSCVKHFWGIVKAKTVNEEVQLQALVDKKKLIITEYTIRSDLQLEDANGVDCLPNAAIFEQLTLMGAKTTAWNEFSSTMASAIICLATNQKFNFSKYIFDNMVKNVDSMVKFWMYPRFVQVFVNKQVGDMSHHKRIYVTPSHTKKIFGNMKREGKGFSGRVTPLFQTMMVQAHEEMGEGSEIPTDPHHTPIITQPSSSQPQRKQKSRKSKKKNTEVPQPSGSTDNVPDENAPTTSNDPLLSGEDILKLTELIDLCTNLQKKVHDLEKAKTAQDSEIVSLEKKVKKLERRNKSRTPRLKRLRKVGSARRVESSDESSLGAQEDASKQRRKIANIDADVEVTLIDKTQGRNDDNLMFDTCVLDEQEVEVEKVVSTAEVTTKSATTTTIDELTLTQTLIEIKAAKPKVRGVMIQEPSEFTTTPAVSKPSHDKGKAKMIESGKPLKKKDQIMYDQEVSLNLQALLQAELEEEERLTRQKEEEANIDLIESWDNTQAMMDADYQMAQQLQAEEQEQLSIKEKSKLFVQLLEARKKHFAEIRAKEKRNKPPTQTQQRKLYSFKRVNTFVDYKTKLVESSEKRAEDNTKRAGTDLEQEVAKKQKIDDDQEEVEMKKLIKVVPDEEKVAIDDIPLATKPPSIVDWKIVKEGKISLFQIIRANGSSKRVNVAGTKLQLLTELQLLMDKD